MAKCTCPLLLVSLLFLKWIEGSHAASICDPPKRVYNFTGDIIIGGLVPVHVRSDHRLNKAGIMWVEAMMFAIREINENRTLLPDLKLGFDIRDSCNQLDLALEAALDFVLSPVNEKPNASLAFEGNINNSMPCLCRSNETNIPRVMAVVGGATSGVSTTVAPLFSANDIPQISYSSTSPSLSDKQQYSSFLRTIPSDIYQAEAIADILAYFNWTYVSVVVTDDEYGRNGLVALRTHLKTKGICIAVEDMFTRSSDSLMKRDIATIVGKLKQDKRSSVVVLWCDHPRAIEFLQYATGKLFNMTWIGTEAWGSNSAVKNSVDFETVGGMLGVLPFLGRHMKFENHLKSLTPKSQVDNPWLAEYWAEEKTKCGNCSDEELPSAASLPMNKYANVIDAVYAIANGLQSLQDANPKNLTLDNKILPELLKHVKKVKFHGFSSKGEFYFSDFGDPHYGAYGIKNLQGDKHSKKFIEIAYWDGERAKLEFNDGVKIQWNTGERSPPLSRCSEVCKPGFSFVKSSRECCWSCVKCAEDYVKDAVGNTHCSKCPVGYSSNANRTECMELELDFLPWQSIGAVVILVFCFLGLVFICFVLAVFRQYSTTAVVKASNRELSAIHLICHGLVYLLPALFIGRPNDTICVLRPYCFSIFFTLITSITFLKTDRIVRIFNSKSRLTKRSRLLSNKVQLMMTLAMTSIPIAGTTVWVRLRPLTATTERIDLDKTKMVVICGETAGALHVIQLSYFLLVALLCTYEAYKARRLPESFNEAKFICFSMFGFVLMWIGYIPGYLDTVGSTNQFITCLFILLTNYTTLVVIYAPKLLIILFHPEDNRHETFRQSTLRTCLELASRIPSATTTTSTPELMARNRSASLPNAYQTSIYCIARARSSSVFLNTSNGSREKLVDESRRRALEERSDSPISHVQDRPSILIPSVAQVEFATNKAPVKPLRAPKYPDHIPKMRVPIDV